MTMLVEIRPGEGGREAEDFASELFGAMIATARVHGSIPADVKTSARMSSFVVDDLPVLRELAGTHRVQRVPDGSPSRHTSTATVAVLDGPSATAI